MPSSLTLTWGNLPANYCFTTPEAYKNDIFNLLAGSMSVTGLVISMSTPAVGDRDKGWIKLDSSGRMIGLYTFLGSWLSPNPRPPSISGERIIWADTEANLWLYDGGDGTDPAGFPPTATTGAMWQKDAAFNFKLPMGAGTNSVIYDGGAATVLAQGANLGEERHTLSDPEMQHQHYMFNTDSLVAGGDSELTNALYVPRTIRHTGDNVPYLIAGGQVPNNGTATVPTVGRTSGPDGDGTVLKSHQNLPPVVGVFFAKRTVRAFYVG